MIGYYSTNNNHTLTRNVECDIVNGIAISLSKFRID